MLNGKRARFRGTPDSPADLRGGHAVCDRAGPDDGGRTWFLKPGRDADGEIVVEARIVALHHKHAAGKRETRFVGSAEHRPSDAARVGR